MSQAIFGFEPVIQTHAAYVQKHDMLLVCDGKVMPTFDMVVDVGLDPEDRAYMLIRCISQRSMKIKRNVSVTLSRKGMNKNRT